jgi:single-strand DNA-binding protein
MMGRLTKDPELRYTSTNNTALCNFSIAVDRRFSKPGEEKQTDFFNVTVWRQQAEFISKYFTKGSKILLVGSLQNRTWDDAEGKKHYATDIVADEVYFAESRKSEGTAQAVGTSQPGTGMYPDGEQDDELPF